MKLRLVLSALLVAAVAVAVWLGIRSAGQTQTIARLESELRAARRAMLALWQGLEPIFDDGAK